MERTFDIPTLERYRDLRPEMPYQNMKYSDYQSMTTDQKREIPFTILKTIQTSYMADRILGAMDKGRENVKLIVGCAVLATAAMLLFLVFGATTPILLLGAFGVLGVLGAVVLTIVWNHQLDARIFTLVMMMDFYDSVGM